MGKATTIKELQQQILSKVYPMFSGMDEEYKKLIAQYHEVASQRGKFTQEYINEYAIKTTAEIVSLKVRYEEKALKQLEAIEEEHTVTKNPKAEPRDTQERLLYEIQRMNNMKLFEAKMKTADINALKEMYDENKDDEDFLILLNVQAQKLSESNKFLLDGHIKQSKENEFLREINKVKYTLKTLGNGNMYPSNAENGPGVVKFRSVHSDLSMEKVSREGWK